MRANYDHLIDLIKQCAGESSHGSAALPLHGVNGSVYCNCDNPTKYTDANEKTYCKWCGKDFKQ